MNLAGVELCKWRTTFCENMFLVQTGFCHSLRQMKHVDVFVYDTNLGSVIIWWDSWIYKECALYQLRITCITLLRFHVALNSQWVLTWLYIIAVKLARRYYLHHLYLLDRPGYLVPSRLRYSQHSVHSPCVRSILIHVISKIQVVSNIQSYLIGGLSSCPFHLRGYHSYLSLLLAVFYWY